ASGLRSTTFSPGPRLLGGTWTSRNPCPTGLVHMVHKVHVFFIYLYETHRYAYITLIYCVYREFRKRGGFGGPVEVFIDFPLRMHLDRLACFACRRGCGPSVEGDADH